MSEMFYGHIRFNQDIGSWDVSNVNYMDYMFFGAHSFNQDISNWDVGNVIDMQRMFYSSNSFNQDISNWNVINVRNMLYMFYNASEFNQDISDWCVWNIPTIPESFALGTPLSPEYYPVWGTCPLGDFDGDGVINENDSCPDTQFGIPVNEEGCEAEYKIEGNITYKESTKSSAEDDLSGIEVLLTQNNEVLDTAYTDGTGHYVFYVFETGEYQIEVNVESYSQTIVMKVSVSDENPWAEESNFTIWDDGTITSIGDPSDNNFFLLYPNPTNGKLYLETNLSGEVKIFNIDGKLVLRQNTDGNKNEIDVFRLLTGTYLLKFESEDCAKSIQFIKK